MEVDKRRHGSRPRTYLWHIVQDSCKDNRTWKLIKDAKVVAWGHIYGTLYKTHVKICADSLNIVEIEASQNLWH